jgi:hypothetical protein
MKHLKKFNESKSPFLNTLSNEELEEKLKWLRIEYSDIQDEIHSISSILKSRKEDKEEMFSKDFPKSIYDLNKEQIEFILEHNHSITQKKYEISQRYLRQLKGVIDSGFNRNTEQFYFNIVTNHSFNNTEDEFELKDDVVKSINFLVENLKPNNGYVEFGIQYYYDDHSYSDKVRYHSNDNITWGSERYNSNKVNSTEKLLEALVDNDLSSKNDSDW